MYSRTSVLLGYVIQHRYHELDIEVKLSMKMRIHNLNMTPDLI